MPLNLGKYGKNIRVLCKYGIRVQSKYGICVQNKCDVRI